MCHHKATVNASSIDVDCHTCHEQRHVNRHKPEASEKNVHGFPFWLKYNTGLQQIKSFLAVCDSPPSFF